MKFIIFEEPIKILTIYNFKYPFAFFPVFEQLPIILEPIVINIGTIFIVILSLKVCNLVIKDFAFSMKIIHFPVTLICDFSIWVVKSSLSIHLVIQPMTVILASIDVEESSQSVSLVGFYLSNILGSWWVNDAPDLVLFRDIYGLVGVLFWQELLLNLLQMIFMILLNKNFAPLILIVVFLWYKGFCHFAPFVNGWKVVKFVVV